jgi:hypothetical protein
MSSAKILQFSDWTFIDTSQTTVVIARSNGIKGFRCNSAGVVTVTLGNTTGDWDLLQGEFISMQGNPTFTTDSNCSIQVVY